MFDSWRLLPPPTRRFGTSLSSLSTDSVDALRDWLHGIRRDAPIPLPLVPGHPDDSRLSGLPESALLQLREFLHLCVWRIARA